MVFQPFDLTQSEIRKRGNPIMELSPNSPQGDKQDTYGRSIGVCMNPAKRLATDNRLLIKATSFPINTYNTIGLKA